MKKYTIIYNYLPINEERSFHTFYEEVYKMRLKALEKSPCHKIIEVREEEIPD